MREPVGEVGYSWAWATTSQSTSHACPLALLSDQHIPPGTKLFAIPPDAAAEIERLREAVTRLLACPAIADEDFSDPEWGCAETREAEAFARAALAGKEGK